MYDRRGAGTLAALPLLSALTVIAAFSNQLRMVLTGALLWGADVGIPESALRATVADLVAPSRRATAYGIFAAVMGVGTAVGAAIMTRRQRDPMRSATH